MPWVFVIFGTRAPVATRPRIHSRAARRAGIPGVAGRLLGVPAKPFFFGRGQFFFARERNIFWGGVLNALWGCFCAFGVFLYFIFRASARFFGGG